MNRATNPTGEAAGTGRLAFIWLFGGIIEWTIQYLNRWLYPSSAGGNLPFQAAAGDVCAVFFYLWKWPKMFALSRIRPQPADLVLGVMLGYLMTNIQAAMLGRSALNNDWLLTNPHRKLTFLCAVLIVPIAEELIYRAAILGSLLERTSTFWAVTLTVIAATIMHDVWWMALPGQILLCAAYVFRSRSLVSSITAHMVANALVFAPSLLIAFHVGIGKARA